MASVNVVVGALSAVWLGMVLAISFVEAPVKFRSPGVTLPIGLGIGRRVFAALNRIEVALAAAIVLAAAFGARPPAMAAAGVVAIVALGIQLVAVRPALTRRSDRVLAGEIDQPRSRAHHAYIGLELVKVAALVTAMIAALR
jgi:hypothetical protein